MSWLSNIWNRATKPSGQAQAESTFNTEVANTAARNAAITGLNERWGYGDTEAARAARAGRQGLYDTVAADTRAANINELDNQSAIAGRNLNFGAARSGLVGSSIQADRQGRLALDYSRGVGLAQQAGETAATNLRNADEASRLSLIQQVSSGLSSQQALEATQRAQAQAVSDARGTAQIANYAGLFNSAAQGYANSAYQPTATNDVYGRLFSAYGGGGGGAGYYGSIGS